MIQFQHKNDRYTISALQYNFVWRRDMYKETERMNNYGKNMQARSIPCQHERIMKTMAK